MGKQVPAIIYGAEQTPQNLTLAVNELIKAMEQEAFYSQIMNVVIEGKGVQAVVRDMQRNPASNVVQHIDFQRISANKIMHVNVPLHFLNEEICVGVKMSGGKITHNLTEVEITCLPADLPEFIEVDMSTLDVGFSVHLSGLALPAGTTIVALTHGEDHDIPVVSVNVPRGGADDEEEISDEAPVADAEVPTAGDDEE